jgi:Tol biopolymer transport system component
MLRRLVCRTSLSVIVVALAQGGCGGDSVGAPTKPIHVVPAGPRLAYVSQSQLHVVDPDGSHDTIVIAARQVSWYAWHGATERIAYLANGALRILDRATGSDRIVPSVGDASSVYWFDWSPDGSRLLYVEGTKIVVVTASGGSPVTLSVKTDYNGMPTWSPDGQSIATPDVGGTAVWIAPATGGVARRIDSPFGVSHTRWAPNGSAVTFEGAGGIWIAPADGSPAHEILHAPCWPYCGSNDIYQFPRFSPDGTRLAGIKGPGGGLWVANTDGSGVALFTSQAPIAPLPEWSPDGSTIAFVGGGLSSWDVYTMHPDGSFRSPVTHVGRADLPRWVR